MCYTVVRSYVWGGGLWQRGSITENFFYSVQSVKYVEPVGTAAPLAFQNCQGRPLNRPGSKVMTDGTSQFFLGLAARRRSLVYGTVHAASGC